MNKEEIENKRNELNLEIRKTLTLIELVDGLNKEYDDYISGSLDEIKYLEQQINLVKDANLRIMNVFKD